ncbi:hypothetical protein [Cryobacterium sp. W22_MBD10_FK3]|uniref:hypothetical protein n=1 Tax=Cryobacterium sp. W22_MBD10_FK3 TaxID=3240273 RepID=UPI003F8F262E
MFKTGKYPAAGDLMVELSAQEIDRSAAKTAGGLYTVPGTSTVGLFCTFSWECSLTHTLCG